MFGFFKYFIGSAQDRMLKRYTKQVGSINNWYEQLKDLSEDELRGKTEEYKKRYKEGETLDELLPEAFATVKAMCFQLKGSEIDVLGHKVKWEMVPFDVQLVGACAMHEGAIAEMQTGEGKTLTALLPLYLNALSGEPVHLVTVNDYLAQRDCQWVGTILNRLGLTTGTLVNQQPTHERKHIYECDVVYGTASEFGFDYLRDNSMAQNKDEQVQRGYFFAIIDEADSILIDEARTPLIISGPSATSSHMYDELKNPVLSLVKQQKEQSSRKATEAKKILDQLNLIQHEEDLNSLKLNKEQKQELDRAITLLWQVSKSTPKQRQLKKLKENPNIRTLIDNKDLYYYSEPNKEERSDQLAELYIVVEEKRNEYELTDLGIQNWGSTSSDESKGALEDFEMLDLAHEYLMIDEDPSIDDAEKMKRRVAIQEEDNKRKERSHNLRQLLRAHLLMEKDIDYIVQEEKIVIIDENTGRPQPGRRFSDGLHQAIEAKEHVAIQRETQTYATITLQNYFRLYSKRAGMSGTAITEAKEFKETYNVDVLVVPTNVTCLRKDENDVVYMTEREKFSAILEDVKRVHGEGRPILIGTESVETSEKLSRVFKQNKLDHVILNAKNHAKEAEIISMAGQEGSITISTNMAGRGTDIKLGEGVAKLGGLHVIGTTRHQSRRIDRQLRGRSARQGDPGSSQFYVSFEDQLMRLFASEKLNVILQRIRPEEGEPISSAMLTRSIETAQKRIEQQHFNIRKHTLEYDNVMNVQRGEIYSFRNEILHKDSISELCFEVLENSAESLFEDFSSQNVWDLDAFIERLTEHFPLVITKSNLGNPKPEQIAQLSQRFLVEAFKAKLALEQKKLDQLPVELEGNILENTLRSIILYRLDALWQKHLLEMDHLRSEVQLRALGQKDPLMEYKQESFVLFEDLTNHLYTKVSQDLFKFELIAMTPEEAMQGN